MMLAVCPANPWSPTNPLEPRMNPAEAPTNPLEPR
jgi:hypothetical protein